MSKVLKTLSLFIFLFLISGFVFSSPQKTQAACNPGISIKAYKDGVRSVTYTLSIRNTCGSTKNIKVYVSHYPTRSAGDLLPKIPGTNEPAKLYATAPTKTVTIGAGQTTSVSIKVERDISVFHPNGTYSPIRFRAELAGNKSVYSTIATHYVVQNRPDFKFTSYNFPGGLTCRTANPTVIIRNIGWVGTDQNILVQVKNRKDGQTFEHLVTQFISKRETIDLSNRFRGMKRPAPGTYNAIFRVDVNNAVVEEDEDNNRETSKYTSTPCSPKGVHNTSSCEASDGWACDPDNFDRALTIQFYEGSTYLGSTLANKYRADVKSASKCGTNGNVGFRWSTPASLKDGKTHTITARAVNIGSTGSNTNLSGTPKTFQCTIQTETHSVCQNQACVSVDGPGANECTTDDDCTAPEFHSVCQGQTCTQVAGPGVTTCTTNADCAISGTNSISGGVFIDSETTGTVGVKDSDEPYIAGKFGLVDQSGLENRQPITTTDGNGFSFKNLPEGTYSITLLSFNSLVDTLTLPKYGSFINDILIGSGNCNDSTFFDCDSSGNAINVNFGIQKLPTVIIPTKWVQSIGGDIRVDRKSWENLIPGTNYFSKKQANPSLKNGVVFGNDLILGGDSVAKANEDGWYIDNIPHTFPINRTEYEEVYKQLAIKNALSAPIHSPLVPGACANASSCSLSPTTEVHTHDGNVTLTSSTINTGGAHIILIDGNLNINGNITVEEGTFVMFVVSGKITVASNVTQIEGVFSTDSEFIVENDTSPLTIEGNVIALDVDDVGEFGFENRREAGTATSPAVEIVYRPDFVLNSSTLIMYSNYNIQEVAPGNRLQP